MGQKSVEAILEKVSNALEALLEETKPVIVEGRKDREALVNLGIPEERILVIHSGQSLLVRCEDISQGYPDIILLPDWDVKGQEFLLSLKSNFEQMGVHCDISFWEVFSTCCRPYIKDVESLPVFWDYLLKEKERMKR